MDTDWNDHQNGIDEEEIHLTVTECALKDLVRIFRAGVDRANPRSLVRESLQIDRDRFTVKSEGASLTLDLGDFERIEILGAGKASASMAAGIEDVLGERITHGLVVIPYGKAEALQHIRLIEAGHPVPDEQGVRGAEAIAELARQAGAKTLVLNLISGGSSALLPAPYRGGGTGGWITLTLEDKQQATRTLLACGAKIQEFNCIRKHLSALKGGRLAQLTYPARLVNLILSDVVGNSLDTIASGPTVADETTFTQAWSIVQKYGIENRLPFPVVELLKRGAAGEFPETPKTGDPVFGSVTNVILGSTATALSGAAEQARNLGYTTQILSSRIEGEAREVAKVLAAIALEQRANSNLAGAPACLLSGGETTVTLRGRGLGGRNQELALSFLAQLAESIQASEGVFFLSAATDGVDGPTDAAGAFASATFLKESAKRDLSMAAFLSENNSYRFHEAAGSLLKTGPTDTNVCDLHICLVLGADGPDSGGEPCYSFWV